MKAGLYPVSHKNLRRFCVLLFWVSLTCLPGCVTLSGDIQQQVLSAKDAVAPGMVHIRPIKEVFVAGQRHEVLTVGSGFIISRDGYVVTNEHVAGDSSQVLCVLSDNTEKEARVVGTDPETDVAVLKLEGSDNLPHVTLGRSESLEAGQMVLAMGSPHGLARSVSLGIVSVTGRYLGEAAGLPGPYNTWIQTDAAINRGNSGGPLVNLKGEVIGINTLALMGAENLGFALPIDTAREVIDTLIADGRVRRSGLGLMFQEMLAKTDDPNLPGVVISDVAPLSTGHEADVRPGDILVSVNGQPVNARFEEDLPAVRKLIADLPIGEPAKLGLIRNEEPLTLDVTTEERLAARGTQAEFLEWGFTVAELTPELARRAQLAGRTGLLVSGCLPGGLAASAGLTPGDILLEIDQEPVYSLSQFAQLYETIIETRKKLVMLFVQRGALTRFVLVNSETADEPALDKEILDYVD